MKKSVILSLTIATLSLLYMANVSALDYQNSTNVQFTFNPTLTVSVSDNLTIDNLSPGTYSDSNIIDVNVATNTVAGYTLSATVGTNTTNTDLTHSTYNDSKFSSITANKSSLSDFTDNTWGYSYSTDNGANWVSGNQGSTASGYNGLPLDANTTASDRGKGGVTLINTDAAASSSNVKFKIGAKASSNQAAGTYTNTINFYAVSKVPPVSISDAYAAAGKTRYNGYYTMQDMSPAILNAVQVTGEDSTTSLIDTRDNNVYYVTKLADGNIWMTQNLDLILSPSTELNSNNTNLTAYQDGGNTFAGYRYDNGVIYWTPGSSLATPATITGTLVAGNNANMIAGWTDSGTVPYQVEAGDRYNYTSGSSAADIIYTSLTECKAGVISAGKASTDAEAEELCKHYHLGNYYNYTASIAMNNSSSIADWHEVAPNSICPAGWRLPKGLQNPESPTQSATVASEYNQMLYANHITDTLKLDDGTDTGWPNAGYANNGFIAIRQTPVWLSRSGYVYDSWLYHFAAYGLYWSSTAVAGSYAYLLQYVSSELYPADRNYRYYGLSLRCLADNETKTISDLAYLQDSIKTLYPQNFPFNVPNSARQNQD